MITKMRNVFSMFTYDYFIIKHYIFVKKIYDFSISLRLLKYFITEPKKFCLQFIGLYDKIFLVIISL